MGPGGTGPPNLAQPDSKTSHFRAEQNFRSISPLTVAVSEVNTSYSSSESRKSAIVNSQIGVGDSKYVVVFDRLPIGHVIRAVAVLGKNIWGAWPLIIWEATTAKRNLL